MHHIIGAFAGHYECAKGRHSAKNIWDPLRIADARFLRSLKKRFEAFACDIIAGIKRMFFIEYAAKENNEREEDENDSKRIAKPRWDHLTKLILFRSIFDIAERTSFLRRFFS